MPKPVIFTIDDDSSVLNSIERDLRAHYGQDYRILPIDSGQILVLYTDGATEATNPEGEEYGRDRLVSAVRACRNRPARDMIDFIYNEIFEWSGGHGAGDDVTFVIIKAL